MWSPDLLSVLGSGAVFGMVWAALEQHKANRALKEAIARNAQLTPQQILYQEQERWRKLTIQNPDIARQHPAYKDGLRKRKFAKFEETLLKDKAYYDTALINPIKKKR